MILTVARPDDAQFFFELPWPPRAHETPREELRGDLELCNENDWPEAWRYWMFADFTSQALSLQ